MNKNNSGENKALAAEEQRKKQPHEAAEGYEKLCPALEKPAELCGSDTQDTDALAYVNTEELSDGGEEEKKQRWREIAARRYENWLCQSGEAHALYPEFDLTRELENEEFKALLRSCIPVKTAYEFVHREEFLEKAKREFEKELLEKAFAGAVRPKEGALNASGGTRMYSDVSNMSKNARQEIIKRVRKGEKISF